MSLASLKKSAPSPALNQNSAKDISVDDFINDAEHYALGKTHQLRLVEPEASSEKENVKYEPLQSHCLRIDKQGWQKLDQLSQITGHSRSKLVRIWLSELQPERDFTPFLTPDIR